MAVGQNVQKKLIKVNILTNSSQEAGVVEQMSKKGLPGDLFIYVYQQCACAIKLILAYANP